MNTLSTCRWVEIDTALAVTKADWVAHFADVMDPQDDVVPARRRNDQRANRQMTDHILILKWEMGVLQLDLQTHGDRRLALDWDFGSFFVHDANARHERLLNLSPRYADRKTRGELRGHRKSRPHQSCRPWGHQRGQTPMGDHLHANNEVLNSRQVFPPILLNSLLSHPSTIFVAVIRA